MGCGRPVQVDPRRATRRGWGQIGSHEPTLEGSFRGNRLSRGHQEQLHTDQASSPSGVLAAQLYGGLHHLGGRREGGRAVAVVWRDAVAIAEPKPAEETANGGARQAQGRDDLTGPAALFPEPEHRLTDRDRDGTWHGQTSQKHYNESNCPMLYQCRDAIKPGVGISRSNFVSRDRDPTPDLWIYRSDDGGRRWQGPTVIAGPFDFARLSADLHGGKPRLFVAVAGSGRRGGRGSRGRGPPARR